MNKITKQTIINNYNQGLFFDPKPLFDHLTHYAVIGSIFIIATLDEKQTVGIILVYFATIMFFMNIVRGTLMGLVWSLEKKHHLIITSTIIFLYWMLVFFLGSILLQLNIKY